MKEKDIQTIFKNINTIDGVFELKLCKQKSIRYDALADHQREALINANSDTGLYHKISDFPVYAGSKNRFNAKKPFDCFRVSNFPAYVVICFYVPRKSKDYYYIPIKAWIRSEVWSPKKSINREEIERIALYVMDKSGGVVRIEPNQLF